jgi:WD40 repeat protein
VRFLDTATGTEWHVLKGYRANVESLAFRPDGTRVLTATDAFRIGGKAVVREWELPGGEPDVGAAAPPLPHRFARSRGGDRVAVRGDPPGSTDVIVRDREGREISREQIGASDRFTISPDGRLVLSWSGTGELKLWEPDTGKVRSSEPAPMPSKDPLFSPDSRRLAVPTLGGMKIVSVADFKQLCLVRGTNVILFSPDARRVIAYPMKAGGTELWDVDSGLPLKSYRGFATTVTFSPDSRWFVAPPYVPRGQPDPTIAPDPRDLIVRDAETGEEHITLKGAGNSWCVFSPDGTRLLVASEFERSDDEEDASGPVITVWSLTTGKVLHRLQGHSGKVAAMAFSPDGKRIASAASEGGGSIAGPGTIKLWDAASGRELLTLTVVVNNRNSPGGSSSLSFSRDGNRLFLRLSSPRGDGGVSETIWDATPRAKEPARP